MNKHSLTTFVVAGAALSIALAGCSSESASADASDQQAEPEAVSNRIDIPSTVRSNLGITFASVERRRVESTIRVPGSFEILPLARREYRMTLPGQVDLMVDQYQRVEPGDVLFRFRSPQWPELQHEIIVGEQQIDAARAGIEVARARIEEAEQRLAIVRSRLGSLSEADLRNADLEAQAAEIDASLPRLRAELVQAETSLSNAERTREHALHRASTVSSLSEQILSSMTMHDGVEIPAYRTIDWVEVRATDAGVVDALAVTDGAFADAPSLVLSTLDPSKLRFRAAALQADLVRIGDVTEARIVPPTTPGIPASDAVDASVTIGIEAHPTARTLTLLAEPKRNLAWFRPGVSAFLEIITDSSGGPALVIPQAAVVKDGLNHVFFRRDPSDPNKAIRVEADLGVSDGRWIAINSGLSLNDEVVLAGAYELRLATQQSGTLQKGGHFHADGTYHAEDE